MAGLWCKENKVAAVPPDLIGQARIQARRIGQNVMADMQIAILCGLLQGDGLAEVLDSQHFPSPLRRWRTTS
ncbi:MAG: hypothetical protein HYU27_07685 [Acidobacteria bacterium]|nr:hypothetical protein [Acidobacteriota bacterium]